MDAAFIQEIIRLFGQSALAELEYTEANGARLHLRRPAGAAPAPVPSMAAPAPAPSAPAAPAATAAAPITAGFPGTFYRRPGPGEPPYAELGAEVAEGQVLGILEAMKTLNPIEADRAGWLQAIHAQDGESVATGAPLFTIA